jgi:aspartate/methionine/tyrosine aminotransferase
MKYLPESWENLFQWIKRLVREYEVENGEGSSLNIAVWEPDTSPPETLRKIVAEEVLLPDNANHTYWDNRSPEWLNRKLVLHHSWVDIDNFDHLDTLVLPWEKPMLGLLPIACWANRDENFENNWYMVNAPAYDVVSTWSSYLWEESFIWPIYSHEDFKLKVSNLPEWKKPRLIVVVKPGNPCPVWASREEWEEIIEYAIKNNIRLVNDWAYSSVIHEKHIPLSEVAKDYKELDWIEFFSISKTLSACGWRVWVAAWSKDFISELVKIKWNTDSGAFW